MIGDWMGSIYGMSGKRSDYHLFVDHNGRYERVIRAEEGVEHRDAGHWEYDKSQRVVRFVPEQPNPSGEPTSSWQVLSVTTCEDSNVLLVLREIILASRNLPILFYRVHNSNRGYGSNWQARLEQSQASRNLENA